MKNVYKIFIIGVITSLFFFSCKDPTSDGGDTQTKEECLSQYFSYNSNGSQTSMYTMIHPDNPDRDNYKLGTPWTTIYTVDATYSISSISGNTYTVNVDPDGGDVSPAQDETFIFREYDDDYWLILSFTDGGGGTTY